MKLLAGFSIALEALQANALRSLLTMLGIIIGVAAVIVMVSVSSGARQQVDEQIANLGTNMLFIRPGSSRAGGRSAGAGSTTPLTERDMRELQARVPTISAISGVVSTQAAVVYGNSNWTTQIDGIHPDYLGIRNWRLHRGRLIDDSDVRAGAKVAIIGASTAEELFRGEPPVGARIRIRNVPFEVIGTLARKGQNSWGRDTDDVIMVPITTARNRLVGGTIVPNSVQAIVLGVESAALIPRTEREIDIVLREMRRIRPGEEADFSIRNIAEFIRARQETQNTLGLLLGATAGIALIVGGIGIMNIMLVSVTERTREIGLRMAVGARPRDVQTQFLVEAVTLALIGGLIGVVIGAGGAFAMAQVGDWPVLLEPAFIAISLGAAACIGIFFGYYPARRAARLNPIDALRFE